MPITLRGLAHAFARAAQNRQRRERISEIRTRKGCGRLSDEEALEIMQAEAAISAAATEQRRQEDDARMRVALAAGMSAEDAGLL